MSYRVIVFDWDGTIMNSEGRIVDCVQESARANGLPVLPYDETKQIIGLSLQNAIKALYPDVSTQPDLVAAMSETYTQHFLYDSEVAMQPFAGAREMLEGLREFGYKTAIATGKSRIGLNAVLEETGFAELFDFTRTPVESASKPDPLMLSQILDHFGLPVEQALMVGDTTFDMEMAKNIAMDRVALLHGVHKLEQLQAFDPVAKFDDLTALQDWLVKR